MTPPDNADEDDPIPAKDLQKYRLRFFERYEMTSTNDETTPGDRILSHVIRALQKRTLQFKDLEKVLSMKDESGLRRIKRKVGDTGLAFTIQEAQAKTVYTDSLETWTRRLTMWLDALAIVGAEDVDDPPKDEFGRKRKPKPDDLLCNFTKIPWMLTKTLLADIQRYGDMVSLGARFEWVKTRTTTTVEAACKAYRESEHKPFGRCLQDAMDLYVAMWQPDISIRKWQSQDTVPKRKPNGGGRARPNGTKTKLIPRTKTKKFGNGL